MTILQDIYASRGPIRGFVALGFLWGAFAALVPVLKTQIGASDAAFGMVFLVSSVGPLFALWAADRLDRKWGPVALTFTTMAVALAFLAPSLAVTVAVFAVTMLVLSSASGVMDVLMNARVSEIEASETRHLMGVNHAAYSFAYAAAALGTGAAREAGWGPLAIHFAVGVAVFLLSFGMTRGVPPRPDSTETPSGGGAVGLTVTLLGVVVFAAFFAELAVEGWSAIHLERTLNGGAAEGSYGPALLGITMGIGRLMGQVLSDRLRELPLIAGACLVSTAGLCLAAMAPGLTMAYAGFALMGAGISVVVPVVLGLVGKISDPDTRVTAIARATVIGYVAFFVGPSLFGVTSELFGIRSAFWLVAGLLVAVAVVLVPVIAGRINRDQ